MNVGKSVSDLNSKLKGLEKVNIQTKQYQNLNKDLGTLVQKSAEAQNSARNMKTRFEDSQKATEKLGRGLKEADAKVLDLTRSMAQSTAPTAEMKTELNLAKVEAAQLKKEYSESAKETSRLGKEFNKASAYADKTKTSVSKQRDKLDELSASLEKASIDSGNLNKDQAKLEKQIDKTARAIERQEKRAAKKEKLKQDIDGVKKNAKSFAKTAAIIGAAAALPLASAIKSESVMADVAKVVDFDSVVEQMDFEKSIRQKIGKEIPMAFEDMGDLVASGAQSGIDKAELLDFSTDAAKMGVAFDIEAGDAGEKMAKWRSAFKMNQEEVVSLADKINYLSDNSAATAPAISDILSRVGALGEVAGISSGEVAAIGASMVSMGTGEEVAATAIKKMSTSLTKGAAATKKQQKAFSQLGLSNKQVAKDMQTDAQGTIINVLEKIRQLPKEAQTANLTEIFGEQAIGAIAPLLTNLDLLKENFHNVNEEAGLFKGSMEKEFQVRSGTTENKLVLLKNNIANLVDTVGKILLPVFSEVVEKITEVAMKVQEWADKNPELMQNLVEVAMAVAGLVLAASGLKMVMGAISILFSPIGLGLAALAAGAYILITNWDQAKAKINEVMPNIWNTISGIMNGIRDIWNAVWPVLGPIVMDFGGMVLDAIDGVLTVLGGLIDFIAGVFTGDWGRAWDGVLGIFEGIVKTITGIWEGAMKIIGGAVNWIKGALGFGDSGGGGNGGSVVVSSTGVQMSAYATGGIVSRPELAWVGEGGSAEAIIPLEKKANSLALWQYAGQQIGALGSNSTPRLSPITGGGGGGDGDGAIQFVFQIDARGADVGVEEKILQVLREASPQLRSMIMSILRELNHDKKRVAFS